MLTWLELFLASTALCAALLWSVCRQSRIQKQINSEKLGYFFCRYSTHFRVQFSLCLDLDTKSVSVMSLSAAARTTADVRVYMILQNKALSIWIMSTLVLSLDGWTLLTQSLFYIPWQFKLKGLLDSLSSLCFLGNRLSSHKSDSAVSEVLPEWSCIKFTAWFYRLFRASSD